MKKAVNTCDLQSCFLCRNSSTAVWLQLIETHRQNTRYKKGEIIFAEGEKVKGIYFLFKGKVKVHKQWGQQKELIIHFAKEGEMIGYRGIADEKTYPISATALGPVTVCFIDLAFFESFLEVNHQLTYCLMKFYANELHDAEKRMRNLAHMNVKGRFADTLLMLKRRFGQNKDGSINIILSKRDIASYTGTTYETLFRIMNELIEEKVINITGKKIILLKEKKLEELTKKSA